MPLHSPPASISAFDGRREALKTSWVNPDYPDLPDPAPKLDVPFFTSRLVDPNGKLGLNPDGTWQLPKLYNWSSWKPPRITFLTAMQFTHTQGFRIIWRASGGDLWRSGWAIYISQTKADVEARDPDAAVLIARHGGEYNPGSVHGLKYNSLRLVQVANDGDADMLVVLPTVTDIWDHDIYGEYSGVGFGNLPSPDNQFAVDPTDGEQQQSALFTALYQAGPGVTGDFYISVVPLDGRQFHTLANTLNPSEYGIDNPRPPGDYIHGRIKVLSNLPSEIGDGDQGDAIRIFNGMGGLVLVDAGVDRFTVSVQNVFASYLSGPTPMYWVAVAEIQSEPSLAPDNTPREVYDYSEISDPQWLLLSEMPFQAIELAEQTTYTVTVAPFTPGDDREPTTFNWLTSQFSTALGSGQGAIHSGVVSRLDTNEWLVEWEQNPSTADSYTIKVGVDGTPPEEPPVLFINVAGKFAEFSLDPQNLPNEKLDVEIRGQLSGHNEVFHNAQFFV